MPPLGCLPASIRLYGKGGRSGGCVARLNGDAETFNRKLNATVEALARRHADLKIAIFDIYTPLRDLSEAPATQGNTRAGSVDSWREFIMCVLIARTYAIVAMHGRHLLGFSEATKTCCQTGTAKTRVYLCNPATAGMCRNASDFVYFDGVHPSEAANVVIADSMISAGISLVT
ncbi:hypothetical protein ABZP36_011474 [Zizania latifolia]